MKFLQKNFPKLLLLLALSAANFQKTFAQIDLELTGTLSNTTPAIFTNVDYNLTLKNNGTQTATNVVVSAPDGVNLTQSFGLVFTSATPSAGGSWNIVFETWTVPSLAPGATATIKLTLFTMKTGLPNFFAEVVAADQTDADSSPANNSTEIPAEDDELLISPDAPTTCDLDIQFVNVECLEVGGFQYITFQVQVNSSDPATQFVKLSTDPTFTSNFIIEPNKPFGPAFANYFQFWTQNPVKFYASPLQSPSCVESLDMPTLPDCGDAQPPLDCVFSSWGPSQIFCLNGGSNYGLVIDLRSYLNFTDPDDLQPNDVYEVFANGVIIGTGVAEQPTYLGLDLTLPLTGDLVDFKIVRTSDDRCLGEITDLQIENYCVPPDFTNCTQQSVYPWHEWIKRVEIDGLDKTSGKSTLSNFQTGPARPNEQAAFVNAGEQMPFKITVGFSWVTYNEFVRIWIDSNRDGGLTDNEIVYDGFLPAPPSGPNTSGVLEGLLNIPADAIEGLTTMKIAMKRGSSPTNCESIPFGEVELYSVNIIGGQPSTDECAGFALTILGTTCNDSGSPDQSTDDRYYIDYQLNWPGHEGEPVQVVAFRGTDPNQPGAYPPYVQGFNASGIVGQPSQYGPVSIADYPNMTFYVYRSSNIPLCTSQTFSVNAPAPCSDNPPPPPEPNCSVASDFPWEDWIKRVQLPAKNFDSGTGKSPYSIFNDPFQLTLTKGVSNPISLTTGFSYFTHDEYWRVWIDYDHDGTFEPSEVALETISTRPQNGVPSKTVSTNFTIPTTALAGFTTMRVMMRRGAYGSPCGTFPFGEVEDYALTIEENSNLLSGGNRAVGKALAPVVSIFPNPAGDFVSFNFSENRAGLPVSVKIFNQLGLETASFEFSGKNDFEKIDLSGIANGQYFLKIQLGDLRPTVEKLVVSRMY